MSGPAVKSHIWPKMGRQSYARRRTLFPCGPGLSSSASTSSSSTSPPQDSSSSSNPASHDVTREHQETGARDHWETACRIFRNGWRSSQKISKTQKCQHPQALLTTLVRDVLKKCHERKHSTETQHPLPERPKLRGPQASQDYKGSLQKANWRSRTSSRKILVTW